MGGFSAVGGMAEFPEQKVHFGRGPSAVVVIWIAIGSMPLLVCIHCVLGQCQTHTEEDFRIEVFPHRRGILLDIPRVIVIGTVFFPVPQRPCILDHFMV